MEGTNALARKTLYIVRPLIEKILINVADQILPARAIEEAGEVLEVQHKKIEISPTLSRTQM